MDITIEKTEKALIEALDNYEFEVVKETENSLSVEMAVDDIDDLAKKNGQGEFLKCRVTRYGNTEIRGVFFNWLTQDWEYYEAYHSDIIEMTESEIEEYNKDLKLEENSVEHPRYTEYKEYCENWQSNFNSQYGYHNGNAKEAKKIMGNKPLSFSDFLKHF